MPPVAAARIGVATRWRTWSSHELRFPVTLVVVVCLATWQLLRDGTVIAMDTATAFYPWYAYLGENLRSGRIPLWNPHQFGGAPFAADPESGWTYLPAMLLFALLRLDFAASAYMVFHLLLAAIATYALARSLDLHPCGAFVSAIAYSLSGFFFGHNVCCFAYAAVAAWLPTVLLGVERARRVRSPRHRILWLGFGGVGLSQILASWLGQGAYYALLYVCLFLAYRMLLRQCTPIFSRITSTLLSGVVLVGSGFGLAAVGLLPRAEYNAVSNLPGGYDAAGLSPLTVALTDWGIIEDWSTRLLTPGFHYAGAVVIALAVAAPVVARTRQAVAFFAAMSVGLLVLASWQPTPLHAVLSILPGFGPMHAHAPERVLLVWFIGVALLAGSTIDRIRAYDKLGRYVAALLIALVVFDLRASWEIQLRDALQTFGAYRLEAVDLNTYFATTAASDRLRQETGVSRDRSIGYAEHVYGGPMPYTLRWNDPSISALGVNNRASVANLYDLQGYNPIHLRRVDMFMDALNGQRQDYHQTDVFESGLSSPLLDLMGTRFIVTPSERAPDQAELKVPPHMQPVYSDATVTIYENSRALPRAWIVHAAVQMDTNQALADLASGVIDPWRTVVLEEPPPIANDQSETGTAAIRWEDATSMGVDVETDTPAMLVVSAAHYPAWRARIGGEALRVFVADGALRAVPVPPGTHTVEFEYVSNAVGLGAALTVLTALLLAAVAAHGRWPG
jgi:hypothetical protein